MYISDWLTLAAVLVALGLGVSALIQTQILQKRERKERLLNEIIEWATEVAKHGIEPETPAILDDKDANESWSFLAAQEKKLGTLQLLRAKSVYIARIAKEINPDLEKVTAESVEKLSNQIKTLYEYKNFVSEYKSGKRDMDTAFLTSLAQRVVNNSESLYASAVHIMDQATKIKTKDI